MKSAVVVPARLRSSRLETKLLTPIGDQPALDLLMSRLEAARLPDVRVLCTTTSWEDDPVVEVAQRRGWQVTRGDEEDVLARYLQAAQEHGADLLVNVDGDDVLCSVEYVDAFIEMQRERPVDYRIVQGLPFGGTPIGVAVPALARVCALKGDRSTQGWGKYFTDSGLFTTEFVPAPEHLTRPDYRLTLDYPEDLELFRTIVSGCPSLRLEDVVAWLDEHPEALEINRKMSEIYWTRFQAEHSQYTLSSEGSACVSSS